MRQAKGPFSIKVNGTMVVGDACYFLDENNYHGVWGKARYDDGAFEVRDGLKFAVVGTAYGDGCYPSNKGLYFGVDAGNIAIAPMELCSEKGQAYVGMADDLVQVIDAVGEATIERDENGTIIVSYTTPSGKDECLLIYTGDDDEGDWDDTDDDDWPVDDADYYAEPADLDEFWDML